MFQKKNKKLQVAQLEIAQKIVAFFMKLQNLRLEMCNLKKLIFAYIYPKLILIVNLRENVNKVANITFY